MTKMKRHYNREEAIGWVIINCTEKFGHGIMVNIKIMEDIMARTIKNYTKEFKKQIVALKINGKSTSELAKEYDIAKSSILKWLNEYNNTGSFKAKDNRTDEENELLNLRKENKLLLMENDILKQAALIIGR